MMSTGVGGVHLLNRDVFGVLLQRATFFQYYYTYLALHEILVFLFHCAYYQIHSRVCK